MRCLITAKLDTATSNQLVSSGRVGPLLQEVVANIKPEAAYFLPLQGRRAILLIADLADASEIVAKLEPLWLTTGAEVDVTPVMVGEDLERGLQALGPNLGKFTS
jgi:hypothetical protein